MGPNPQREVCGDQLFECLTPPQKLGSDAIVQIRQIAGKSFDTLWAEKDFRFFLEHDCAFCYGLFDGRRQLRAYLIALNVRGELDIISLATHPDVRRRGYAEWLLAHAMTVKGIRKVFLEVDTQNVAAVELYKKLGFHQSGLRRKYYSGKRDALLMTWINSGQVMSGRELSERGLPN